MESVTEFVKFKAGHFEIGLPFRPKFTGMPNNREHDEQMMMSLSKRFARLFMPSTTRL